MKPLSAHEITAAAEAVESVARLDDTIRWLGEDAAERVDDYGAKIRDVFGRNRLSQFRNAYLGDVVLCAVINALLDERQAVVAKHKNVVEFPDQPCPRQVPHTSD